MRKKLMASCLVAAAAFFASCGGGGGTATTDNNTNTTTDNNTNTAPVPLSYVYVTGDIKNSGVTTQSIKIGKTEVAYILAATFINNRPTFVSSTIKSDGSYNLKLIKDKEYSFVLYDNDLNPVAFVTKDGYNAIVIKDDAEIDILLRDENKDGYPDLALPDVDDKYKDKVTFKKDDRFDDEDGDKNPDSIERDYDDDGYEDYKYALMDKDGNGLPDSMEDKDADGIPDYIEDRDDDGIPYWADDDEKEKYDEYDEEYGYYDDEDHYDDHYYQGGNDNLGDYIVIAWNDLGMHCVDRDFSVFSILPPYNTIHAQVIKRGYEPEKLTDASVKVYYSAAPDNDGSINSTSRDKTNFWDYVEKLFNKKLSPDIGLEGYAMASTTPHHMEFTADYDMFLAEGLPAVPYDDNDLKFDPYPLVKVEVKSLRGTTLATTTTVMPVSDEMNCKACHGSNSGNTDALPKQPENDPDPEKDFRWNVLKKHDEENQAKITQAILDQLASKGYNYQSSLYQTAKNGTPILCSACHKSNALPGSGVNGVPPLTQAMHSKHATPIASSGKTGKAACYMCHPGPKTNCERGAMHELDCQNCHGTMADVGSSNREGWFDMPTCQQCHQQGKRYHTVFENDVIGGTLRQVVNSRFKTKPDTPIPGKSLYRFSKGHGGLQCSACHGSPHAEYPTIMDKDNQQVIALQGYKGNIRECSVCHGTRVPLTANKGPHGMHTIGQAWVEEHGDYVEHYGYTDCKACHGQDLRGSDLSEVKTTKTFDAEEYGRRTFNAGHKIGCYDCHNGPDED